MKKKKQPLSKILNNKTTSTLRDIVENVLIISSNVHWDTSVDWQ